MNKNFDDFNTQIQCEELVGYEEYLAQMEIENEQETEPANLQ